MFIGKWVFNVFQTYRYWKNTLFWKSLQIGEEVPKTSVQHTKEDQKFPEITEPTWKCSTWKQYEGILELQDVKLNLYKFLVLICSNSL